MAQIAQTGGHSHPTESVKPVGGLGSGVELVSLESRSAGPLSAAEECGLLPKSSFKECAQCREMVVVPSGNFTMGSPAGEKERMSHEGPQHLVMFPHPFAVGRFSVTFDEWDACAADAGCRGYKASDRPWGRGRRPVINVSWDDAKAYVAWLSEKTGKAYRLLSEAEREYVTRTGTTTPFWWGSSISTQQANYGGNYAYDNGPKGERRHRTLPVDSFEQNPWGLYQVHGNVWEWTEDCDHIGYWGAPNDGSSWTSEDCGNRVLRGDSWNVAPERLRAAARFALPAYFRYTSSGFRIGRTLITD